MGETIGSYKRQSNQREIKYNYPSSGKVTLVNKVTSVNELGEQPNDIVIFPNPSHDYINIQSDEISKNSTLQIFNELGEIVIKKDLKEHFSSNDHIDVQSLTAGLYIVKIVNQKNKIYNGKFLVENK